MTRQLPRPYSPAHPRADVRPPEPGQAYFGYPQPSRSGFPVPQQSPSIFEQVPMDRPTFERTSVRRALWPVEESPLPSTPARAALRSERAEPAVSAAPGHRQPSHALRRPARSRTWRHFVGYPLAVILGLLIGVVVAVASGDHHCAGSSTANGHTASTIIQAGAAFETTGCR
jgi:hypothetical protein